MSEQDHPIRDAPDLLSEDNLARRIRYEMEQRGWSQERMSKELNDAGHPMHQTSVGKIVNPGAGKRRTISVDDALAFAKVFGLRLDQLLIPLEAVLDDELFDVLMQLADLNRERAEVDIKSMELVTRFVEITQDLGDEPENVLRGGRWSGSGPVVEELRRWGKSLIDSLEDPQMKGLPVRDVLARLREKESRDWQRTEPA